MLETLNQLDTSIFLFLNKLHTDWLDPIMWFISGKKEWIPAYLIVAIVLFKKYRWYGLVVLAGVGVTVVFADQFSSGFCKPYFERLRPSHAPNLSGQVYTINNYLGGKFGFISSHAANSFGIVTFLYLILKHRMRYSWGLFIWSAIVSYSRIYLGVHYPGDIIAGAIAGIFFGWLVYILTKKLLANTSGKALIFSKT